MYKMTEFVVFKNTLAKHNIEQNLICDLIEIVKKINNYDKLKLDIELTTYVCNYIQNSVKKHAKIDKKSLVVSILGTCFQMTLDEVSLLEKQIQYLYDNKKIKDVPVYKFLYKYAMGILVKQVS